jgi:hypothetical protein
MYHPEEVLTISQEETFCNAKSEIRNQKSEVSDFNLNQQHTVGCANLGTWAQLH